MRTGTDPEALRALAAAQKPVLARPTLIDTVAALVPAELLALHAAVFAAGSAKKDDATVVTEPGLLKALFFLSVVAALVVFVIGRLTGGQSWRQLDFVRMWIPPLAFVGWAMLTTPSAFDAVAPDLTKGWRLLFAGLATVVLGALAKGLADKADQATPDKPTPDQPTPD